MKRFLPWIILVLAAGSIAANWLPTKPAQDEFDFAKFGKIPVLVGGRVKPLDTVALTATIYNFDIELADSDRSVYESLALRVARHPSESEDYLIARLLAYTLEFSEGIEFSRNGSAVELAGYFGPIEVEIFNRALWDMPGDEVLELMKRRYLDCV